MPGGRLIMLQSWGRRQLAPFSKNAPSELSDSEIKAALWNSTPLALAAEVKDRARTPVAVRNNLAERTP